MPPPKMQFPTLENATQWWKEEPNVKLPLLSIYDLAIPYPGRQPSRASFVAIGSGLADFLLLIVAHSLLGFDLDLLFIVFL